MVPTRGVKKYYKWFFDFTEQYYCEDENINNEIRSRIEHSISVVRNILSIRESDAGKTPEHLKEIAALFHDIGRFRQIRFPNISYDQLTEDHAEMGVKLLREAKILEDLPERERELILKSIFFHNKKNSHLKSNDSELIEITELLREADKMDISKRKQLSFNP